MITTVLLDLDGVLLDHRSAALEGVRRWLGDAATPEVVRAWSAAQDRRLAEWRAGTATWAEQRRARVRDVLPLLGRTAGPDDELDAVFEGYLAEYERAWQAFDDAAPAVRALHAAGLATAVLTNGSEVQQTAKLRAIGLLDVVGPVFTAEALGLRKPDARAFLEACGRLGADPHATLHVGDEHEIDVLGARSAGLPAVLLDRDGSGPQDETEVVASLLDLLPRLRARRRGAGRGARLGG